MADQDESNQDESKGFKIRDRRRFTESGEVRSEGDEAETAAPEPVEFETTKEELKPPAEEPAHPSEDFPGFSDKRSGPVEISLSTFLLSLSTQALMLMGEIPDPVSGAPVEPDLNGVAEFISLIGMLQEKTRGNLDEGEAKLIEQILYDLRMRYVSRVQGAGSSDA